MPGPQVPVDVVRPGEVLSGKFRIERVLGVGGMGVVVAATHLQLGQLVALKFLLPAAMAYPENVSRFEREARAAVRLRSDHVAKVTDVGRLDDGAPYMVMEFLEGQDLDQVVRAGGALPIRAPRPITSSRRARRSRKRTAWASCTAISSRRTSS